MRGMALISRLVVSGALALVFGCGPARPAARAAPQAESLRAADERAFGEAAAEVQTCLVRAMPPRACMAAVAWIEGSCLEGHGDRCELARAARQAVSARTCEDESPSACEASCDKGDLDACSELGSDYVEGQRTARDTARGAKILRDACAKGSARACYLHGAAAWFDEPGQAVASLRKACLDQDKEPWDRVACSMWLAMVDEGRYAPSTSEEPLLLQRMCEREPHGGTCSRLKGLADKPGHSGP